MIHRRIAVAAIFALTIGLITGAGRPEDTAGVARAEAAIAEVGENQNRVIDAHVDGADLVAEGELADVVLPVDPNEPIVVVGTGRGPDRTISIGLPPEADVDAAVVVDGTVVYEARGADSADVAVQVIADGSVQMLTVIPSPDAPHEYSYPLTLPAGTRLVLERNGGVTALDTDDNFVAGLAAPWAKDATGADVPTSYRLEGTTVVQVIAAAEPDAYPVVADPWMGIALIDNVTRSFISGSGYRYFVYPSWWGRVGAPAIARGAAWEDAKAWYPTPMNRVNLRDQFWCHFDFRFTTFAKGSWNLEVWRPNVGWAATVAAGCNPT